MFLAEIADGDNARSAGQVVAVADLQGGIGVIGEAVKLPGRVKHRLAVAGDEVDLGGVNTPVCQAIEHQLAVELAKPEVEQGQVLQVDLMGCSNCCCRSTKLCL